MQYAYTFFVIARLALADYCSPITGCNQCQYEGNCNWCNASCHTITSQYNAEESTCLQGYIYTNIDTLWNKNIEYCQLNRTCIYTLYPDYLQLNFTEEIEPYSFCELTIALNETQKNLLVEVTNVLHSTGRH